MPQLIDLELIVRGLPTKHTVRVITPGSHFELSNYASKSVIYQGNSEVQTGAAKLSNGRHVRAVCKMVRGDSDLSTLRHEAALYDDPRHLRTLQGSCVPIFFGYYECEVQQGSTIKTMGCMVLEHCGPAVTPEVALQTKIQ